MPGERRASAQLRIDDDYLERAFKGARRVPPPVPPESEDPTLRVVFGRAFLLELQRGDVEQAQLFARALLVHAARATSSART